MTVPSVVPNRWLKLVKTNPESHLITIKSDQISIKLHYIAIKFVRSDISIKFSIKLMGIQWDHYITIRSPLNHH